jgi:hypothetical protein
MHHAAINYTLSGLSASSIIKDTLGGNQMGKVSPGSKTTTTGSVTYVTSKSQVIGSGALPVDYLIITYSSLFNSSSLSTFANYRANHNGFDVAIVQVDNNNIYNWYPEPNKYQSVQQFIADVYNNGKAKHTGDGHLAYILLVGDAFLTDNSSTMVPANYSYTSIDSAGDYYYACTAGGDIQTLMYGRLPVVNETELSNIVTKTINYEANTNGKWNENYAFMSFSPDLWYNYNSDYEISTITDSIPSTCNKSYAYRAYTTDPATQVTAVNSKFPQRYTLAQFGYAPNLCGSDSLNF